MPNAKTYAIKKHHYQKAAKDYKATHLEKYKSDARKRYDYNAEILNEIRKLPCADCGKSYPWYIMEFDHIDPSTKKSQVSAIKSCSLFKLIREIVKCDVVCANCHRVRTFFRRIDCYEDRPLQGLTDWEVLPDIVWMFEKNRKEC